MWYVLVYFSDVFEALPPWTSLFIGLAIGAVGLVMGPPLLRMHARFSRLLLGPTEAARLAQRVAHLTETRSDAVDAQAAELRRIERDLHDGAQSRMIAVGLSLGAIEQLLEKDPAAARELLRQARATSATALADLRDLVRGIHPPVLSERGLADAVRAIALDTPLPVRVTVDREVDTAGPATGTGRVGGVLRGHRGARERRAAQRRGRDLGVDRVLGPAPAHAGRRRRSRRRRPGQRHRAGRHPTAAGHLRRHARRQQPGRVARPWWR